MNHIKCLFLHFLEARKITSELMQNKFLMMNAFFNQSLIKVGFLMFQDKLSTCAIVNAVPTKVYHVLTYTVPIVSERIEYNFFINLLYLSFEGCNI